jgi:hypothetical protein
LRRAWVGLALVVAAIVVSPSEVTQFQDLRRSVARSAAGPNGLRALVGAHAPSLRDCRNVYAATFGTKPPLDTAEVVQMGETVRRRVERRLPGSFSREDDNGSWRLYARGCWC